MKRRSSAVGARPPFHVRSGADPCLLEWRLGAERDLLPAVRERQYALWLLRLDTHVGPPVDDLDFCTGIVLLDGSDNRLDAFRHAQHGTDSILHGDTPFSTQST